MGNSTRHTPSHFRLVAYYNIIAMAFLLSSLKFTDFELQGLQSDSSFGFGLFWYGLNCKKGPGLDALD